MCPLLLSKIRQCLEWYENGKKILESSYRTGKKDGRYKSWYASGTVENEGCFRDGFQDGLWTEWYEGGNKKIESNYKNGNVMVVIKTGMRMEF